MSKLFIITGASRGLGKCLAVEASAEKGAVHLVLFGRNKEGLESTKAEIAKGSNASCTVDVHAVDFADLDNLPNSLEPIFKQLSTTEYGHINFVVNHGSLGPLKPIKQITDFKAVREAIDLNVTSTFISTSIFLKYFEEKKVPTVLVNLSSLAAIQPFDSWGTYCVGKAGREMLFRAVPGESGSHVKTLNYAPGPCDTDMQKEIRENCEGSLKEYFVQQHEEGKLVNPVDSMKQLLAVLDKKEFTSGAHLDYFDIVNGAKST